MSDILPRSGSTLREVDTEIRVADGVWNFGNGVADSFVSHVRKSVPLYDMGHFMAAELASCFMMPGGCGYEIGVSTGELVRRLASHNARTASAHWVGIDCEPEMIEKASEACRSFDNIELVCDDIRKFEFERCDFVVDFLTTQFLTRWERRNLYGKVFKSLREGGAMFIYEKTLQTDGFMQDLVGLLYSRFKRFHGLTHEQIALKSESVYGVIKPETRKNVKNMLKSSGFAQVSLIMKYLNFEGYLAVKR
jgi:tRNA (cmo5U34)-methyltransferase